MAILSSEDCDKWYVAQVPDVYHLPFEIKQPDFPLSLIYPEDGTSPVGAGPVVVVVVLVGLGSDPESSPLGGNKIPDDGQLELDNESMGMKFC